MLHKFYINRSRSRFCSFLLQIYEFWGCSDLWGLLYKFRIDKKAHLMWDFKKKISLAGARTHENDKFLQRIILFPSSIGWIIFSSLHDLYTIALQYNASYWYTFAFCCFKIYFDQSIRKTEWLCTKIKRVAQECYAL